VVLFEHDREVVEPGTRGEISALAGSWDRYDLFANAQTASTQGYLEGAITHAESGNYEDGDGTEIHSFFERQSATLLAGYRPDLDTRIDLDAVVSRGEAAYADRSMDGSQFDRESYGATFAKDHVSPLVRNVTARVYHSYIDHVMDDYSLRTADSNAAAMNPDRETNGARLSLDLDLNPKNQLKLGADWRDDEHTARNTMDMMDAGMTPGDMTVAQASAYTSLPRLADYQSEFLGVFGELTHELNAEQKIIGGLRLDDWSADRWSVSAVDNDSALTPTQTYKGSKDKTLPSGFVRFEQDLANTKTYIGFGHNERPMDYWEATKYNGLSSATVALNPEKTNQIDAGLIWKDDQLQGSLSAFYAKVDDYILVWSGAYTASSRFTNQTSAMMGSEYASGNIDATRYGAEADVAYKLDSNLTLRGGIAYVHADNDTHNVPLAQTPPLEGTLGLDYKAGAWTFGSVFRAVAKQDRIDEGYGTIVGQDLSSATAGFGTLALNANYQTDESMRFSIGMDNVFDKTYAEHISKSATSITGYSDATGVRVNEPGRSVWIKANLKF
jgi:iron complex outermembrane receptor protein